MRHTKAFGFLVTALLGASLQLGCSGDGSIGGDETTNVGEASDRLIAELTTSEGVNVRFLAVDAGEITVVYDAPQEVEIPSALRESAPVTDLYEALAGQKAPQALRDAWAEHEELVAERAARGLSEDDSPVLEDDSTPAPTPVLPEVGPDTLAHDGYNTGDEWINDHCFHASSYSDCRIYQTCTASTCRLFESRATAINGVVNALSGDFWLKLYRANVWGNYKLLDSVFVNQGHTAGVLDFIVWKRYYKATVTDVQNDLFHYFVVADT